MKEAERQFGVVPGRAHGDCDHAAEPFFAIAEHADLERLLDSDHVVARLALAGQRLFRVYALYADRHHDPLLFRQRYGTARTCWRRPHPAGALNVPGCSPVPAIFYLSDDLNCVTHALVRLRQWAIQESPAPAPACQRRR